MLNRIERYGIRLAAFATGLALVFALAPSAEALPIGRVNQNGTVLETSTVVDFYSFTNQTDVGTNINLGDDAGFFADDTFVYKVSQTGAVFQYIDGADMASGLGNGIYLGTNSNLDNDRGMFSIAGLYYTVSQSGYVYSYASAADMATQTGGTVEGSRSTLANDTGFFADAGLGGIFTINQDGKVFQYADLADFIAGTGTTLTGSIAGLTNDAGFYAVTTVPEPGTLLLLTAGLGGLFAVGGRRRG